MYGQMGSPKLDLWVDSWNAVYPEDKIYIAKTTSAMDDGLEGNYLGLTENPTTTYISGTNMRAKVGYNNTLYYPHKDVVEDYCYAYWLLSPSAMGINYVQ